MKQKRVMLIMPPFTQTKEAMKRCIFPLGIGYLAAVLEKEHIIVEALDCIVEGYDTEVVNDDGEITFGLRNEDIEQRIMNFKPDFVGVSCLLTRQAHNAHRICKLAKQIDPAIQTIMGGGHPSVLSEMVLSDPNVNHVVVGEGETAILEIVAGRKSGIVQGGNVDTKTLPWPARHLFSLDKYIKINMPTSVYSPHDKVTQVEFTRGCPFKCCFCATTQFRGHYRKREIDDCLAEIRFLKDTYGIEELDIIDSNLIVDKKWTKELLIGMKKIGISWANPGGIWVGGLDEELIWLMKESGCYQLSLAIESSTPRILNEVIGKPTKLDQVEPVVETCRKAGIDLHAFFVVGFPEQTREEIINDYKFAKRMRFTSASFNIISPLPGSRIFEQYKSQLDFTKIDLRKSAIPHPTISQEEMAALVHDLNRKFNSSLLYRNPIRFMKKYGIALLKKPSFRFATRIFNRQ